MSSLSFRTACGSAILLTSLGVLVGGGCSDDPEPAVLETSVELLDAFSFDTGLVPSSGPVQLSIALSGSATATVRLPTVVSDADGDPALYPAGPGTLEVSGGFGMDGRLKVDVSGIDKYDGDIPGLADISLPISGNGSIDAYALDGAATVTAAIAPGELPAIPLPGGIPGKLQLSVADGSAIDVALTGSCAGVRDSTAEYRGAIVRGGELLIDAKVVIEIPVVGDKDFEVGTLTIPLPEETLDVEATKDGVEPSDPPEGASAAGPSCKHDDPVTTSTSSGGEGGAGGAGGSTTATGTTSVTTGTGGGTSFEAEVRINGVEMTVTSVDLWPEDLFIRFHGPGAGEEGDLSIDLLVTGTGCATNKLWFRPSASWSEYVDQYITQDGPDCGLSMTSIPTQPGETAEGSFGGSLDSLQANTLPETVNVFATWKVTGINGP